MSSCHLVRVYRHINKQSGVNFAPANSHKYIITRAAVFVCLLNPRLLCLCVLCSVLNSVAFITCSASKFIFNFCLGWRSANIIVESLLCVGKCGAGRWKKSPTAIAHSIAGGVRIRVLMYSVHVSAREHGLLNNEQGRGDEF